MSILDRAELLLQAKNYSGSGDWLDESGNGHDAQLGSTSGSDTNDPLFKPWDGTTYTYLPGTSGNYISTADVNLLDADTAHFHQSIGQWEEGAGSTTTAPTQSQALTPIYGDYHGQWIADGATSWMRTAGSVSPDSGYVAASPATQYTASAYIAGVVAGGATIEIRFAWYDSGYTALGNSNVTQIAVPATFTQIAITATSPASTAFFTVQLVGRSATNGDIFYVDAVQASQGSDATFVPSLRIVGDLDIEAKAASPSWFGSGIEVLAGVMDGADTWQVYFNPTGSVAVVQFKGGSTSNRSESFGTLGLTDGEAATLRATVDLGADEIKFYVDGVQKGSTQTASGETSMIPSGGPLTVGDQNTSTSFPFEGDIYYVIVRDGIDGPIVAEYRASDAVEPFATQTGSVDGRTWTYNRSASGYVSTVVDRAMFLLSTDDYFVVADDDGLDFGAEDDFTVVALIRQSLDTGNDVVINKGATTGAYYAIDADLNSNVQRFYLSDSTTTEVASASETTALLTLVSLAGRRDADGNVEVFVDGTSGDTEPDLTANTLANARPMAIGARWNGAAYEGFIEGQVVAVALFREALTDAEIATVGELLTATVNLDEALLLHGDALFKWIQDNYDGQFTSLEVVGAMNEINGTTGVEYAQARGTLLGLDPAG